MTWSNSSKVSKSGWLARLMALVKSKVSNWLILLSLPFSSCTNGHYGKPIFWGGDSCWWLLRGLFGASLLPVAFLPRRNLLKCRGIPAESLTCLPKCLGLPPVMAPFVITIMFLFLTGDVCTKIHHNMYVMCMYMCIYGRPPQDLPILFVHGICT